MYKLCEELRSTLADYNINRISFSQPSPNTACVAIYYDADTPPYVTSIYNYDETQSTFYSNQIYNGFLNTIVKKRVARK